MCTTNPERSIAIVHAGAAFGAGTPVVIPDAAGLGNIWKTITAINDTDQEIKVSFKTVSGYDGAFIVTKSIKGFTKGLREAIDNTSLKVTSMNGASAAIGNITFNLGS